MPTKEYTHVLLLAAAEGGESDGIRVGAGKGGGGGDGPVDNATLAVHVRIAFAGNRSHSLAPVPFVPMKEYDARKGKLVTVAPKDQRAAKAAEEICEDPPKPVSWMSMSTTSPVFRELIAFTMPADAAVLSMYVFKPIATATSVHVVDPAESFTIL